MTKKILLTISFFISVAAFSQTTYYAYYPFNGNASDASGNNRDAIIHGQPTPTTDRYGNANSAYLFDGIDDYIEMPERFDFKPRTISLWFKSMDFVTEGVVFSSDNSSTQFADSKIVANESAGNYTLNLKIGSNPYVQPININEWYYAAIVYSDTAIKYYVNGTLVGSYNNFNNLHSGNGVQYATVGCHRGLINYFHGVIDEVKINDRALSGNEISETYTTIKETPALAFNCYPNPVKNNLNISCENPLDVKIFNLDGKLILNYGFIQNQAINISDISSGPYFLVAQLPNTDITVRKLIFKE